MKVINVNESGLAAKYVSQAQRENVVLMERGNPVLVLVGVQELDQEQVQLGLDDKFWTMLSQRRKQPTISHNDMKRQLGIIADVKPHAKKSSKKTSKAIGAKTKKITNLK